MKRLTVVFMAVAAFGLMASTAAQAVTAQKATGTIRMGLGVQANDPKQAISFDVFEPSPVKGNITYTNFGLEDEGSGVWVPSVSFDVQFSVNPSDTIVSTYTFTTDTVTTLSPTSVSFAGNGVQQAGPWHGPFTATMSGSTLTFKLSELNGAESYTLNATGQIDANGAVTGTWLDNYDPLNFPAGRAGKIVIADIGSEVFSFTTTPTCVDVIGGAPKVAKFGYTIPAGAPIVDGFDLSGKAVAVKVSDGGSSGVYDTYEHNFAAPNSCLEPAGGTYTPYPITAGNLTVFS
jgi:hypothetical protein